jgi:N-acetylglucosamine malate deacetylase 2
MKRLIKLVAFLVVFFPLALQAQDNGIKVLMVIAHPDDEGMFAGSVYKITRFLGGKVDLAVITDGSGGYRYAQLAEPIYGLKLTDERVAREYLPGIRKQELLAAGHVIGVRKYFFLDAFDHQYTVNVDTVLQHVWDAQAVEQRLYEILSEDAYDFVFCHLPIENFHGHHKAATILALRAATRFDVEHRPVVLGSFVEVEGDTTASTFTELRGYPITKVLPGAPFRFDRMQPLNAGGQLNYRIIANWEIAEHKSQGTMQLLVNVGERERFWIFQVSGSNALQKTQALFEKLAKPVY